MKQKQYLQDVNKNIYKLDVSNPLRYKWSLFGENDGSPISTGSTPIQTDVSNSFF